MSNESDSLEQSICDMYRGGSSLRTLEVAFGTTTEDIIRILQKHRVLQQLPDESWEAFVARVKDDVGHTVSD